MSPYQTVMTAAVANRQRVDGLAVEVRFPNYAAEEKAYLAMTAQESYEEMAQVQQRLVELLHYQKNRLAYRKRSHPPSRFGAAARPLPQSVGSALAGVGPAVGKNLRKIGMYEANSVAIAPLCKRQIKIALSLSNAALP
ncbi:MAG: hypothetical protein ACFCVB_05650 [Nodosilinea sp.]